jgi:hypothetical protein
VRHARFDVASLSIEGIDVPLRAAYLLVAESEVEGRPQWECIAYGSDPAPLPQGRYVVAIATLDERHLEGDAVLVRSVEGAHVLRGDGPLTGLHADDLG